jgi:natural product biosynthesis luciferase-like monooxygenase protein
MSTPEAFSAILIGADTLLAQCGNILLDRGHRILGVVSDEARIASWAAEHGIEVIPADADYPDRLRDSSFDHLFAITHLELIPEEVIATPRGHAINFHDGPLPAYAGLNTPMWALLDGQREYAVSWHLMAAGVDEGDLLLQAPVEIAADDTAVSLNTKCFAAAIESFPVLVEQLETKSLQPQPQDLSRRHYFGRLKKPWAGGVLDWRSSAADLARQVRALDTGRYANPLASAKLLLSDDRVLLVEAAEAFDESGGAVPGTILEAGTALRIGTSEGALEIRSLRTPWGDSLSIPEAIQRFGLASGQQLPQLDDGSAERMRKVAVAAARREPEWMDRLAAFEAIELPYRNARRVASDGSRTTQVLDLPDALLALEREQPGLVAGVFLLFLGRVLGTTAFDVAVADDDTATARAGAEALTSPLLCHRVELSSESGGLVLARQALAALRRTASAGPVLIDLVARSPRVAANPSVASGERLPCALVLGSGALKDALPAAELVLQIDDEGSVVLHADPSAYPRSPLDRLVRHLKALCAQLVSAPEKPFRQLDLLTEEELRLLLETWNDTALDHDRSLTMHGAFEAQVRRTPDAVALVCQGRSLTYRDLDAQADVLAAELRSQGCGPDGFVGVHVPRSLELLVATLGVLKAGCAYVPLDPAFPADRLEFMIADSSMPVILSHTRVRDALPETSATVLCVDAPRAVVSEAVPLQEAGPENLAYCIYTSGSTGLPKGVLLEHRNVVNFFAAMDQIVPREGAGQPVWLAVTSLSFDISVLELFWTLARGFKVIIHDESATKAASTSVRQSGFSRVLDMGLFMWGNDDAPGPAKYRLLMEGARFFDANGFSAVWTPERHFHAFGGPYPNPAVTGAAVAAVTEHVKIRAGSCVVPLHHPVRIAEEWSVVDNLSNGRAEIAAASGWNPNDFVLRPEAFENNKQVLFSQLEQVRALWRGEKIAFPGPLGKDVEVESLPRPVQPELPCWITTAGNPETWIEAGRRGLNVLTHLLGQTIDEVGEKISLYRAARADAGHDPDAGKVALMLHTFVSDDDASAKEIVREPMKSYLASSMKLAMDYAWTFPAFKRPGGQDARPEDVDLKSLTDEEQDTILEFAFERYFQASGLFGSVDTCLSQLARCAAVGVDEIACLLDFGVDTDAVLGSFPRLKMLRERMVEAAASGCAEGDVIEGDYDFATMVDTQGVTHMQCTPSMARMYMADAEAQGALCGIPHLLLGGEALPVTLANELLSGRDGTGTLTNMYGPTETTIWSMSHFVEDTAAGIPIGRPIANTRIYVLDSMHRPVPVGVSGELFIGGEGVARGYLNRPELSAERFLADPFSAEQSARMYATGDLARYRADGVLDFLGRSDFQVKVRGYRIELGEIEAVLEGHPMVEEAAVIVRGDTADDQRLVAFLVGVDAVQTDELRSACREKLPEYMVPNEFVYIDAMPRTANAKLDRKALQSLKPAPVRSAPEEAAAPETELEQTIAGLWKAVLKIEAVGTNENFFDLGGHSLLVVQLHSRLKQVAPGPVSLTDLYQYPTIGSLANFLSSGGDKEALKKGATRGARRRALRSRTG